MDAFRDLKVIDLGAEALPASMIQKMRNELATKIWKKFVDTLRELGFSESEIQTFISANAAERGTYDSITDNGSM